MPVQPLAYTTASGGYRPGLITALGVVAIIVAAMSGIVSFITFFYGGVFYAFILPTWAAGTRTSTSGTFTVTTSGGTPSQTVQPAAQQKLSMGDVATSVNTLRSMLELDGPRIRELDKLLRAHGREIIGSPTDEDEDSQSPGPITDAWLRESIVSQHAATGVGPAWFVDKQGRVEIFRDHATFRAADGSRTINSSAANRTDSETASQSTADSDSQNVDSTTQPAPQGTTLAKAEIRRIMRAVRRASSTPLNPAEVIAIEQQLSTPNQGFVTPGSTNPVLSVFPTGNGLQIQFDQGIINVGNKGQIILTTTTPRFSLPNALPVRPPLLLVVLEGAGSLFVAIYLLIVGIMVCRQSFSSPKLLRIYAWIKIPLACLAGFSAGWLAWRIMEVAAKSAAGVTGGAPTLSAAPAITWGISAFVLGVAFPIAVLISLRTPALREYFKAHSD